MEVMNWSAQNLILLKAFSELAEEAFKAERLIKESYTHAFGLDTKTILVHSEELGDFCAEGHLTIDGFFQYHDNWGWGNDFEFKVDAEGIFKMLRSCYLRRHELQYLDVENSVYCMENLDEFFRSFIHKLEKNQKDV